MKISSQNGLGRRFINQSLLSLLMLGGRSPMGAWAQTRAHATAGADDRVRPGRTLAFPGDHGAHPASRTEWWYVTGALWVDALPGGAGGVVEGPGLGFQVTFFRHRTGWAASPAAAGRFDPVHLLMGHAALTDVAGARLWHDQRLDRWNGEPQAPRAAAAVGDTAVHIGGCSLRRASDGRYRALWVRQPGPQAAGEGLALDLWLQPAQAVLLQGQQGFSRKGPDVAQASHYYTQPQLAVQGEAQWGPHRARVSGRAWLDHEWSDTLMHPDAVGWDWVGMNLDDGAALTAFRLRRADGSALWAGGSWRPGPGRGAGPGAVSPRVFTEHEVRWTPLRWWDSARSGGRYPVAWRLETPAGAFEVTALVPDQELDTRLTTGTVYWEGLSRLSRGDGSPVLGWGYLEMTGYVGRVAL